MYNILQSIYQTGYIITCFVLDPTTELADCAIGGVRFTNFSDNITEDSRQGIIQICINNAWGSVCNDNLFDATDAAVFCNQLEGFSGMGKPYFIAASLKFDYKCMYFLVFVDGRCC